MDVKIKVHTLIIKDEATGKAYKVQTLRSAEELASFVQESEKDEIQDAIAAEASVLEALAD